MNPIRVFHGWWMVAACLVIALAGNALGLFGAGVWLHALSQANHWPLAVVSRAVTMFYIVSACLLIPVADAIDRVGPRPVAALAGLAMAIGVAGIGEVTAPWQAWLAFLAMGIGWAGMSTTAVATTLAPWFEKHHGRAVSIASLGASAGGMLGAPILLLGIDRVGLAITALSGGVFALLTVVPLALFVLRRRPEDLGLHRDGADTDGTRAVRNEPRWTRAAALRTKAMRGIIAGFGLAMMAQIGFLTHQATLLSSALTTQAVAATLSATAVMALLGRLALVHFADRIDARLTAACVLLLASGSLLALALFPSIPVLVGASLGFGLTVGNVTTLPPIIVRREFGAASFGAVFGVASCCVQLVTALGPGFYGTLHDAFGGYSIPLSLAAVLDLTAAAIVVAWRPRQVTRPQSVSAGVAAPHAFAMPGSPIAGGAPHAPDASHRK